MVIRMRGFGIEVDDNIATIDIQDYLLNNAGGSHYIYGSMRELDEMPDVKGIMLRINTGGGATPITLAIYNILLQAKQKYRIYSYISEIGCSSGYMLACLGERIYASMGAMTGSIGAVKMILDDSQKLEKEGIKRHVITSGHEKAMSFPVKEEQLDSVQKDVNVVADTFFQMVSDSRGIDVGMIKAWEGKTFTAEDALNIKVIDGIMTQGEAMNEFRNYISQSIGMNMAYANIMSRTKNNSNMTSQNNQSINQSDVFAMNTQLQENLIKAQTDTIKYQLETERLRKEVEQQKNINSQIMIGMKTEIEGLYAKAYEKEMPDALKSALVDYSMMSAYKTDLNSTIKAKYTPNTEVQDSAALLGASASHTLQATGGDKDKEPDFIQGLRERGVI